jgi:hypothetical protein
MTKRQHIVLLAAFFLGMFLSNLLFGQEIAGPNVVRPGLPVLFELPVKAAWTVAPLEQAEGKYFVDSGGQKIFFATPVEGTYTIVAAFLSDDEIVQTIHTFIVSAKDSPQPNPNPQPDPDPVPLPVTLKDWVAKNVPTGDATRLQRAANVYATQASSIERNMTRTPDAAYSALRRGMQPVATTAEWTNFLKQLDEKIKTSVEEKMKASNTTELQALKIVLSEIAGGMK